MKIYISADMEGIAGIAHWDEAIKSKPDYAEFRERMTSEVVAACTGAIDAGATEILIKDAHGTGRNILADSLPCCARLIRGWSGHPYKMVQELDGTFDAVLMVGYHARAGSDGNPLAHTLQLKVGEIEINGRKASEFLIHAYLANSLGVPVVFVSGDEHLCDEVTDVNSSIRTVAVTRGVGASTISIAPALADKRIAETVASALRGDMGRARITLPDAFAVQVTFADPVSACRASFYPGVHSVGPRTVLFEANDYLDVMRMLQFVVY